MALIEKHCTVFTKQHVENASLLWIIEMWSNEDRNNRKSLTSPQFSQLNSKVVWKLQFLLHDPESDGERHVGLLLRRVAKAPGSNNNNGDAGTIPEESQDILTSGSIILMNSNGENLHSYAWKKAGSNDNTWGCYKLIESKDLFAKLTDDVLKIRANVTAYLPEMTSVYAKASDCPPAKMPKIVPFLFEKKILTDFVIRVQDTEIPVHKCILAASSRVFEDLFQNSEPQLGFLELKDMEPRMAKAMVEYFYLQTVSDLDVTLALDLLVVADTYGVTGMRIVCSSYLQSQVCATNVIRLFVAASDAKESQLKDCCVEFVFNHRIDADDAQKAILNQRKDLLEELFWRTV